MLASANMALVLEILPEYYNIEVSKNVKFADFRYSDRVVNKLRLLFNFIHMFRRPQLIVKNCNLYRYPYRYRDNLGLNF